MYSRVQHQCNERAGAVRLPRPLDRVLERRRRGLLCGRTVRVRAGREVGRREGQEGRLAHGKILQDPLCQSDVTLKSPLTLYLVG